MKFRFLSVFLLGLTLFATSAHAQGITAIVNGQAISDYDVIQRQRLLNLSGQSKITRESALEELINDRLKLLEAGKYKISISDAQVERAFAQIAQRSNLPSTEFVKALQSRGVDAKTLRERLRAELAWQQVVQGKAQVQMLVRDQDIVDALKQRGQDPDKIKGYEFQVMQAVVFVPKNSAPGFAEDRKRQAESFRSSANGCANAKVRAQAFKDAAVREPIHRNGNELNATMRTLLEKTPIGQTTPVQQSETGFEFLIVCDKKEISGREGATSQIRSELMSQKADQASKQLMQEVRQKAVIDYRKK